MLDEKSLGSLAAAAALSLGSDETAFAARELS